MLNPLKFSADTVIYKKTKRLAVTDAREKQKSIPPVTPSVVVIPRSKDKAAILLKDDTASWDAWDFLKKHNLPLTVKEVRERRSGTYKATR